MSTSGRAEKGTGRFFGSESWFEALTRQLTSASRRFRQHPKVMAEPSPSRIYAFDWLRGVAVLVMLQTHSLVLLLPELTKTPFFTRLVSIDGLVAPSFIFSAGFALALVQVRAGLAGKRSEQAKKTLKRIGEVLLVASYVNFIWFPMWREPKWLLRIDILQCIGISLLLLLPVLVALSTRPRVLRWVTLLLALGIFGVSPYGEQVTGFWSLFLNNKTGWLDATTGAAFPLLPWAGYVFLGASFGATIGAMKSEKELWAWLALLIGLGALLFLNEKSVAALYPPHNFWVTDPADAARRWTYVLGLVAVFRLLERQWLAIAQTRVLKWLAAFGGASLSAYFFHEMLLYHHRFGLFARFFREKADWPLFWVLVGALIALTWVCVQLWDRVEKKIRALRAKPTPSN
jgi:uncharacterized membrane protein